MQISNDGATLVLRGDFDARSTSTVRAALDAQLAGVERDVIIDLSAVEAIDLTATRLLAAASLAAGHNGHHLTLRGCGPAVRRMLHLSRLARFVELEREVASA